LRRELASLREIIEARLDGADKATELRLDTINEIPALIKEEISHLEALLMARLQTATDGMDLKIKAVNDVSNERFAAIEGTFQGNALALAAALAAQKEAAAETNKANALAIGKSETGTKESLQALQALMSTGLTSLGERFADLKSRLDRGEGQDLGGDKSSAHNIAMIGAVGAVIGIILGLAAIFSVFKL
jgi:NADH dehydrogenase/NADH:ubiquinone oxidoreductase subunit G